MIDAQLPPSLARTVKSLGFDAIHVSKIPLLSSRDRDIWVHAQQAELVILTKDQDFAALRQRTETGPVIVWLRRGNITNTALAERLLVALPQVASAIENGETLIEVI